MKASYLENYKKLIDEELKDDFFVVLYGYFFLKTREPCGIYTARLFLYINEMYTDVHTLLKMRCFGKISR